MANANLCSPDCLEPSWNTRLRRRSDGDCQGKGPRVPAAFVLNKLWLRRRYSRSHPKEILDPILLLWVNDLPLACLCRCLGRCLWLVLIYTDSQQELLEFLLQDRCKCEPRHLSRSICASRTRRMMPPVASLWPLAKLSPTLSLKPSTLSP